MNRADANISFKRQCLYYSALFLVIALVGFSPFYLAGKSVIWQFDGLRQTCSVLMYMGIWMRGVIASIIAGSPEIPLWSFGLGYGSDLISTLGYYGLGDPLCWLSVFVPARYTEYLYDALVVLRPYLAGLAFIAYCNHMKRSPYGAVAGALSYAFCGFSLFYTVRHPFFITPMLYFPLVLSGVERIFEGKSPAVFIISIACVLSANFYFFYMLAVFCVVYVLVRFFAVYKTGRPRAFVLTFISFLFYGTVGALIAGVVFAPLLLAFITSDRAAADLLFDPIFPPDYYASLLQNFFMPNPSFGGSQAMLAPALLGVIALFFMKGHTSLKFVFVMALLMLCLPAAGSALNGFSYVSNRWVWVLEFLMAFMFATAWPALIDMSKIHKAKFCTVVVLLCALTLATCLIPLALGFEQEGKASIAGTFATVTLVVACLVILCIGPRRSTRMQARHVQASKLGKLSPWVGRHKTALFGMVVFGAIFFCIGLYSPYGADYANSFVRSGAAYKTLHDNPLHAAVQQDHSGDFFRLSTSNNSAYWRNSALFEEVPTTGFYWSLSSSSVPRYLGEIGIPDYKSQNYTGLDRRTFANELASVKYYLLSGEAILPYGYSKLGTYSGDQSGNGEVGSWALYENEFALPFGYTYSSILDCTSESAQNMAQRQELAMQAALLSPEVAASVSVPHGQASLSQEELAFDSKEGEGLFSLSDGRIVCTEPGATLTLSFDAVQRAELSLLVEGMNASTVIEEDVRGQIEEDYGIDMGACGEDSHWYELRNALSIVVSSGQAKNSIIYKSPYYVWPDGQSNFMVNLGYSEEPREQIVLAFSEPGIYSWDALRVVAQGMENYPGYVEGLTGDVLENVEFGCNSVQGAITTADDKILCLSMPYVAGWRATVDGHTADLFAVNTMYAGLLVEGGSHTIELKYRTPGLIGGCACSVVGIVLLVALTLYFRQKRLH